MRVYAQAWMRWWLPNQAAESEKLAAEAIRRGNRAQAVQYLKQASSSNARAERSAPTKKKAMYRRRRQSAKSRSDRAAAGAAPEAVAQRVEGRAVGRVRLLNK